MTAALNIVKYVYASGEESGMREECSGDAVSVDNYNLNCN